MMSLISKLIWNNIFIDSFYGTLNIRNKYGKILFDLCFADVNQELKHMINDLEAITNKINNMSEQEFDEMLQQCGIENDL